MAALSAPKNKEGRSQDHPRGGGLETAAPWTSAIINRHYKTQQDREATDWSIPAHLQSPVLPSEVHDEATVTIAPVQASIPRQQNGGKAVHRGRKSCRLQSGDRSRSGAHESDGCVPCAEWRESPRTFLRHAANFFRELSFDPHLYPLPGQRGEGAKGEVKV